jgi:putative tryptophan/tyrosine transport system substrate-binding protein
MHDLGWREGRSIEYLYASADGDASRLDALAGELIEQKVEVIVAATAQTIRAAQRVTKKVPIVIATSTNAVGNGLVASLGKPGGNTTGHTAQSEEIVPKLIGD